MGSASTPYTHDTKPKINLDAGGFLDIKILGLTDIYKAAVIGTAVGEYILIKPVLPDHANDIFYPNVSLYASYLYQGSRFGFESRVLETIDRPYPLTFIRYPDRVDLVQKRRAPRTGCHIPSSVTLNNAQVKGTVTNISKKGCRFVIRLPEHLMPRQITLFDDIALRFPARERTNEEVFHGAVRNTLIDREKISLGIEFMDTDSRHLSYIGKI